jgi:alcohol dehydrogenase class IV
LNDVASVLSGLGLSRPLIVTDRYLVDQGVVGRLVDILKSGGGTTTRIFSDVSRDPTTSIVDAGVAFMRDGTHDCIIGFGGGSPIDTAKAISVLACFGGFLRNYKAPHVLDAAGVPVIAIPTTAGTGSEATRFAVVTDEETQEKMLCAGAAFLPVAAIVDFELTLTKPARLTADAGIDALTHAIESYVSR